MEIELSAEESRAVQTALRRYVSDLRMEIVNTDNPAYKRSLHEERDSLERAIAKLDTSAASGSAAPPTGTLHIVRLWWVAGD